MRERFDPLIAERAAWLFADNFFCRNARRVLDRVLSYDRTVEIATLLRDEPNDVIMRHMADMIARDVQISGLENVPAEGPALIVANHPTGIADGIIMWHAVTQRRKDPFFYANSDILRVMPQMETMIAPVEWRLERRSHAKTRETMAYTRKAIEAGRIGVIFPSGRLAKRRWLKLHEREWMASAAMIARKWELDVIPVNVRARNSALFYLFDLIHPSLRDITLFHETLNKDRQPYRLNFGRPIPASALSTNSNEAIEQLKTATLRLGGRHAPTVSLAEMTRRPRWVRSTLSA
ncbi:1-acyl-sn-glycerol-3-phosphate acyltransferase [Tropicimonas sp. IMCC6043]|uniref:1-acyl-sn-glycerol-3-phosphate acyltransferase n=1 Tax=Tropicimonas sp. IMCC6043 TaxID=2510645 RepID=UPI00101C03E1|nr:1-acyl-sn-glycerol-3-phosphate acyltransferase [Tropicimonas sp. IMCC6043]RYH08931.1 glycerol acyltransferase [Tropicimonas sp. IMCC6043]